MKKTLAWMGGGSILLAATAGAVLAVWHESVWAAVLSSGLMVIAGALVGSVASAWSSRRMEIERRQLVRADTLRALLNEVERIQKIETYYQSAKPDVMEPAPRMPVAAFEQAFITGQVVPGVHDSVIAAVTKYLVIADEVNSLVDVVIATSGQGVNTKAAQTNGWVRGHIKTLCTEQLRPAVSSLSEQLRVELAL